MFIDEINRGNIAKIFGELITLMEADKRATYAPDGALLSGLEVTWFHADSDRGASRLLTPPSEQQIRVEAVALSYPGRRRARREALGDYRLLLLRGPETAVARGPSDPQLDPADPASCHYR